MNSQNMSQHDSENKYCILHRKRRGKEGVVGGMTKTSSITDKNTSIQLFLSEKKAKSNYAAFSQI